VGHHNHKYFILFLVWTSLGSIYSSVLIVWFLINSDDFSLPHRDIIQRPFRFVFILLAVLIAMFAALTVSALTYFTIRLACFDITTVEMIRYGDPQSAMNWRGESANVFEDEDRPFYKSGYSWMENLQLVLGNVRMWLVPVHPGGDGLFLKHLPFLSRNYPARPLSDWENDDYDDDDQSNIP
jgi:hypothetical protein